MKSILLTITFIFFGLASTLAQNEETLTLTVNIKGLKSDKGVVLVGLYNNKNTFLKEIYKGATRKISNKKSTVIFTNLPKGEYAVSFVHDKNNNGKMDTNIVGIPKEDYGCSNNATGFMGPPAYDNAKFVLSKNKSINISL
ncbi:DUF2141 domain-containing protein [uncultured Polaribacter sp.]|uniref:DUF2141 domain-containing protein n=1 Tax=uncultured Polaribacter sp. TaxID=174711 RepID=UPI002623CB3E|nr:DUF2141 domain-containing protein [uncultured Polaribacter sp.]